jgi:hypothetical protein
MRQQSALRFVVTSLVILRHGDHRPVELIVFVRLGLVVDAAMEGRRPRSI